MVVDEIHEHLRLGAPLPSDDLILIEGWQKYLIIHTCFGENVNRTLAYTFEEVLSRKGLIRLWYLDGYRIMIELTVDSADLDLKGLAEQLFGMSPEEFERTYAVAAQRNFPFPGRVKAIAERFGALEEGAVHRAPEPLLAPDEVREHARLRGGAAGDGEGPARHEEGQGAAGRRGRRQA